MHTIAALGHCIPRGADLRVAQRLRDYGYVKLVLVGMFWTKDWHYKATLTDRGREVEMELAEEALS